jgi:hypothetical protein
MSHLAQFRIWPIVARVHVNEIYYGGFSPTLVVKGGLVCNAPDHSYHHLTYAFVLASHKRINPRMMGWTLEALYVVLTHL